MWELVRPVEVGSFPPHLRGSHLWGRDRVSLGYQFNKAQQLAALEKRLTVNIHIPAGNSSSDFQCAPVYRESGQAVSLLEGARTVYRYRTTLLWFLGAGLLAGALLSALQPRMYRSQAAVQVQGVNENFLSLRDIYPTAAPGA